jgi:nicotinamidase/pyrazinamidase
MTERIAVTPGDVLLVVDVQNDFWPGGNLPVRKGDEVVPIVIASVCGFVTLC